MPAKHLQAVAASTLVLGLLALVGCNKPSEPPKPSTAAAPAVPTAPTAPYAPPSAEQLSQMVAPIALFPDKLVGQVLAGATYPEQISAANQWLAQNPSLKGDALQAAEAGQPWDVSVKSLTAFPSVLNQMAGNLQWTTALGEAYVNDPNDVMNAIQVLRLRAQQAGNLKTSPHLRVSTTLRESAPPADFTPSPSEPMVYAGPAVIPAPQRTIVIEPAEPDVVYVPHYDPAVVYGAPVAVYPGWTYRQPAYTGDNLVTTGVISFGVGVLVGAVINHHHDWGWNAWGVNWGAPRSYDGGWQRPAVVYNNATYISKSVTVVNHVNNVNVVNNNYGNNVNNRYQISNNVVNRTQNLAIHNVVQAPAVASAARSQPNFAPMGAALAAHPAQRPAGPMTVPHFTTRDAVPGSRPSFAPPAMHAAVAPHVNAFAPPHVAPVAPMARHEHAEPGRDTAMPMRERGGADVHMPPAQHAEAAMPPARHAEAATSPVQHAEAPLRSAQRAEAFMPHGTTANHDVGGLERSRDHAARQDMVAMHNERPHVAPPAPVRHLAAKHEDNHHHEKREGQERHG
jgi:hypothetical protein